MQVFLGRIYLLQEKQTKELDVSAFILPKTHIDAMLTAAAKLNPHEFGHITWVRTFTADDKTEVVFDVDSADEVGSMLIEQNVRSVNYLRKSNIVPAPYAFDMLPGLPDTDEILGAISCYTYQSGETPDWVSTEAYRFIQSLTDALVSTRWSGISTWLINSVGYFTEDARSVRKSTVPAYAVNPPKVFIG